MKEKMGYSYRLFMTLCLFLMMLLAGCSAAKTANTGEADQYYEVKRGEMQITVTSDGTLSMPNQFDLRFGTNGTVKEILVEEGDKVNQGALLAFMDNTMQKNAVRTALFNLYAAVNNSAPSLLTDPAEISRDFDITMPDGSTVTISNPRTLSSCTSCFDRYSVVCDPLIPKNYADITGPRIFKEAQKDLGICLDYLESGAYRDAGFKLALAYADIEVCEDIIKSKIDASVYAGAKQNTVYWPESTAGTIVETSAADAEAIAYLQSLRQRLLGISSLIMEGSYNSAESQLDLAQQEMVNGLTKVKNTVQHSADSSFNLMDTPTSLNFLQSSMRELDELGQYAATENASAEEIAKQLYIAKLNLNIGSDVLAEQMLNYGWGDGFTWQKLQTYNLNVQNAEIAFSRAKQDLLNTFIVAPSDGVVVSVDLKQNAILSAQDYSTKTAIKLVDTDTIKFSGNIDEIDIFSVKTGQKAGISVDALPDQKFSGTVKFVSPFGTTVGKVIKFPFTIELDPSDVALRGGLSATALIDVYSAKDVLLVPSTAVTTTPMGSIVMLLNTATGKTEPRPVTVGRQSLQYAEILSGLQEGDKILQTMSISALPSFPAGGHPPNRMIIR
jgi:multidrug efflux pump subunit AcrA (membrane-fusion protein)